MSSLALPEEAHLLFVCEGTFEQYLISELLQAGKLIVDASSVVDITRTRGASQIQSQYLKKVQNYKGDDLKKYIEKIAKDELGYVGDGERIFINVAGE